MTYIYPSSCKSPIPINPLDNDHDFLPRSMGPGLTVQHGFLQLFLQICHIIMLEHLDGSSGEARAQDKGRVVQLITQNQAALQGKSVSFNP